MTLGHLVKNQMKGIEYSHVSLSFKFIKKNRVVVVEKPRKTNIVLLLMRVRPKNESLFND